jgi:hypothetical protein
MKKLLILLFSLLFLSSPSVFADDISDFEIEGISIGDSLLDYMTKEEILEEIENNINDFPYLNEPKKYISVYLWKEFPTYDFVSVFIKNNSINKYLTNKDEKYTILSVRGYNRFIEDYDNCLVKRDEIVEIFSGIFPYSTKQAEIRPKSDDPSGNSIFNAVYWFLEGEGLANLSCSNYEEKFRISNNKTEGLSVIIRSEEVNNWLNNVK